jgi:hypothetical protein
VTERKIERALNWEEPMRARSLESDDWIDAQYFDWERFDHFLTIGRVTLNTFAEFKRLLEEGIKAELAKRPAAGN